MKIFLIAPYHVDVHYSKKKRIIEDICQSLNMSLLVADNINPESNLDANQTTILLRTCDFAIADLSYERPSCYYEIGYLQALEKKVYFICQENTLIHQLILRDTISQYSDIDSYRLTVTRILKNEIHQ